MTTFAKGFLVVAGGLAAIVVFLFAAWLVLDAVANYSGFADCVEQRFMNEDVRGTPPEMAFRLAVMLLGCVNSVGTLLVGLTGAVLIVGIGYGILSVIRRLSEITLEDIREWRNHMLGN